MLSTTSKYALRALVELARAPGSERVLGHDLAELAGLPANYLSKILVTLRKAGMVEASRGSGGGYRLSRPADKLSLKEVVQLFDGPQDGTECLLHPGEVCSATDPCAAHFEWARLREHFVEYLTGTSVGVLARVPAQPGSAAASPGLEPELSLEEEEN